MVRVVAESVLSTRLRAGSSASARVLDLDPGEHLAAWVQPGVRQWHGQFHRSVLELAPVIMTGTVHRPMELAVPIVHMTELLDHIPQAPSRAFATVGGTQVTGGARTRLSHPFRSQPKNTRPFWRHASSTEKVPAAESITRSPSVVAMSICAAMPRPSSAWSSVDTRA